MTDYSVGGQVFRILSFEPSSSFVIRISLLSLILRLDKSEH
jgi:hypothetical protein